MDQPIQPANEAEIDVFLKAAEHRFAEMGVDPDLAAVVFNNYLAKQAQNLGIQVPEQGIEKAASFDEEDIQLAVFLKSAVDRFVELGVPEEDAIAYLDAKLAAPQPVKKKIVKIANRIMGLLNKEGQVSPAPQAANQYGPLAQAGQAVANAGRTWAGAAANNAQAINKLGPTDYLRAHMGMSTAPTAPQRRNVALPGGNSASFNQSAAGPSTITSRLQNAYRNNTLTPLPGVGVARPAVNAFRAVFGR